jgi:hypothetical protein
MEPVMSNRGVGAAGYALIALPVALLLSIYLLAYFPIARRFDVPDSCRLDPLLEYPAVRG